MAVISLTIRLDTEVSESRVRMKNGSTLLFS